MTEGEGRRRVILTFDDGPNPGCTDALLDLLGELGIRATFCVVGQNILAPGGAELVRRTVEEGHAICNHSIDYEDLGSLPAAEVRSRLGETTRIIRDALGDPDFPVRWFRAPNGSWGPNDEVADLARSLGMAPLRLGNVIHDWTDEWQVADVLEANLRTAIRPGAVVLAHDGGGRRAATVEAFRRVLPELVGEWGFDLPPFPGSEN